MRKLALFSRYRLYRGRGEFSPASLFLGGITGVWYDPSDVLLNWRTNLEVQTEDFSTTYCLHQGINYAANQVASPTGTITADLITENTAPSTDHRLGRYAASLSISSGATYTGSVYVKRASGTRNVILRIDINSSNFGIYGTNFDLTNLTVNPTAGQSGTITDAGNGWYRLTITATSSLTYTPNYSLSVILSNGTLPTNTSYTGDGTSGIYVWGAQLELGSTATAYQAITTPEQTYLTYDPQPVLFQDSAGATPVTAVEQPVGLMLDKSQGLVLGSELVTNGDFSSASNWVTPAGISIANGQLLFNTSSNDNAYQNISYATGRTYRIEIDVVSYVRGTPFIIMGGVNVIIPAPSALGRKLFFITTINNTDPLRIYGGTAGVGGEIIFDNVSVKELPGNHAVQSTNNAFRPTLKARYNLLTYSQEFDNAAWTKGGVTAANTTLTLDPIGGNTADLLVESSGPADRSVGFINISKAASAITYTFSVYAKKSARDWAVLTFYDGASVFSRRWFNLNTGQLGGTATGGGGFTSTSASITDAGNGWYRCVFTATSNTATRLDVYVNVTDADSPTLSYTGNGSNAIYVWGAQLVTLVDNDLIDGQYQRVAAATDYNTDPALFPVYLDFDGSNDFMVSNSINFTSTDKVTVWAGVGKDTDAAVGVLTEFSVNSGSNNGSFIITAPNNVGTTDYAFGLRGTALTGYIATSYTAPCYNILSCLFDINGADTASEIYPQVDGTVPFLSATGSNAGTGNFGTYPLYLGSRAGSSFYFNGKLFGLIVRGAASTSTEIYQGELWMAGKEDLTLYPDAAFNPLSLFAGGAPGAWYKPSDFYNYMSQLGPELVTNGSGTTLTGWTTSTWTINGSNQFTANTGNLEQSGVVVVGNWYQIEFDQIGSLTNTLNVFCGVGTVIPFTIAGSSAGRKVFVARASGDTRLIFQANGAGTTIDNISVKQLTGTFSMYQEATGVTPVTAVEQSVGLILDQSKGLVRGTELITGAASAYTGNGTVSTVGDTVTATCTTNGIYGITWLSTFVSNQWVLMTAEVVTNSASKSLLIFPNGNATALAGGTTTGNKSFITLAPTATGSTRCPIFYINGLAGESFSVRLVSIKEVPGNHAFQSTPANCPVLRARYNLLTYSEQFNNAAWTKTSVTAANTTATTAPDGTLTANELVNTVNNAGNLIRSTSITTFSFSIYAKAGTQTIIGIGENTKYNQIGQFDLANGTATKVNTNSTGDCGVSIVSVGNGWFRCIVYGVVSSTASIVVYGGTSYLGGAWALGTNVYIWGADLRIGSSAGTYQRIAAATDYATGSAFPVYLAFDGSNDSLATNSIDFSATNKMFVCSSVTKLSDNVTTLVAELSVSSDTNNGTFYLGAPITGGSTKYAFQSKGTIQITQGTTSTLYSAPTTNVISGIGNISAPSVVLRVDGDTKASNASSQGTGNYGNYPLYIGARAGTSLFFNGRIFDLLVCGALVDFTDVANTEYYMAGEAGLPRTLTYDYVTLDSGDQITTDSGDPIYDQITFT